MSPPVVTLDEHYEPPARPATHAPARAEIPGALEGAKFLRTLAEQALDEGASVDGRKILKVGPLVFSGRWTGFRLIVADEVAYEVTVAERVPR